MSSSIAYPNAEGSFRSQEPASENVSSIAHPNLARTARRQAPASGTPEPFTKALLLAGIRLYQAFLSPLAFSACKFHPSCSRYAYEAIDRHGARRGAVLALRRLWRCRPFAAGGYDPVPDAEDEAQ